MQSVVLVTGGASGLGLGAVNRFHKTGRKVVICDLESSNGAEIANNLGNDVLFIPCDVTSESQVKEAVQQTKKAFGRLDVVVNCAGIIGFNPVYNAETKTLGSLDFFKKIYEINVFGTYNVICSAVALMAENQPDSNGQRGVIINTSSIAGYDGCLFASAYASSKSAINGLTLPLAREFGSLGIRVMAIAPGSMNTPLAVSISEEALKEYLSESPFPKRLGDPDEFAHLCESIVENYYLNGEVIRLDGAQRVAANLKMGK